MKNKPIFGPILLNFDTMYDVAKRYGIPQGKGWPRKCALIYSNLPQLLNINYYTVKVKCTQVYKITIYKRKKRNWKAYAQTLKDLYKNYPIGTYARDILIDPYLKEMKNIQQKIEFMKLTKPYIKIEEV